MYILQNGKPFGTIKTNHAKPERYDRRDAEQQRLMKQFTENMLEEQESKKQKKTPN